MNNNEYIDSSVEHFRELLCEQLDRTEKMEKSEEKTDFTKLKTTVIGVCGGDGIGPIITREAQRVLEYLLSDEIKKGTVIIKNIEGLTIENRLKLSKSVPDDILKEIKSCNVLLKGPTTTPKGGTMESANVTLRRELDLYANVRPIKIPEKNIDWVFFRENTEGEYVLGSRGIEVPGKLAFDFKVTTDPGTRRIAKAAFDYAKFNGKHSVSIVSKANIMKKTDGKFSSICHEVAENYKGIDAEDWYIDIMAANLVNEDIRSNFQVILLPNLYGDIITDEAAQIQGGVGTAGSSNIGDKYSMFEAIHGSAPRMVEEGLAEYANPSSIFKATEMLLRHINRINEANLLMKALEICTETEKKIVVTGTKDGAKCCEFADYLMETIKNI